MCTTLEDPSEEESIRAVERAIQQLPRALQEVVRLRYSLDTPSHASRGTPPGLVLALRP